MTGAPQALRNVAFGLTLFVTAFGTAFIVGTTLMDPGGVTAVVLSASWLIPMIVLVVYAQRRTDTATMVLTVLAALVAVFVVLDALLGIVPRDEIGPVASVAVFAVAVALGFLGLHRPARAGWLLLLVGGATLVDALERMLEAGGGRPDAALGGSSAATAVPFLVVGALYLIAAAWKPPSDRDALRNAGRSGRVGSAARTTRGNTAQLVTTGSAGTLGRLAGGATVHMRRPTTPR